MAECSALPNTDREVPILSQAGGEIPLSQYDLNNVERDVKQQTIIVLKIGQCFNVLALVL